MEEAQAWRDFLRSPEWLVLKQKAEDRAEECLVEILKKSRGNSVVSSEFSAGKMEAMREFIQWPLWELEEASRKDQEQTED